MYTGDPLTSERSSFENHFSPKAHRQDLASVPGRPVTEAPHEEQEDNSQNSATSSSKEQELSASLLSEAGGTYSSAFPPKSPHTIRASSAQQQPKSLSASPAAMFLSSFMNVAPAAPKPDDEGQVIAGYTLGPIIGYGGSSIIRRAKSSSGSVAAVKIICREDLVKAGNAPQARKRLQHEAAVWATLTHEHILPLFSAVHTPYADYFFTLYCPAGSLFDILKRDGTPALPQDDAGMMFRQVVRGLRYLHEVARYVHGDMKLENVLVDDMGVCKIGDFGMTRKIGSEDEDEDDEAEQADFTPDLLCSWSSTIHRSASLAPPSSKRQSKANLHLYAGNRHNTIRHRNSTSTNQPTVSFQPGSLPYAAPELLLPQTSDVLRPHPGQDIWALGVMLCALLTGHLPFYDSFEPRLQMKILNGTYEIPQGIGRGAERILQGCLERSIANRWTIAMVDEVAWGVGWGAEGDDATPTDPHEDPEVQFTPSTSTSRSQSRSRPPDITIPSGIEWQQEEPRSRPSIETASRRSSSRVKRSLSRAPVLTDISTSSRSASRSVSRHPRGYSPTSSTRADPLTADAMISMMSSSSSLYDTFDDSALISPALSSPSIGRGRRPNKPHHSTSRSPSPSVVPTTPTDGPLLSPSTSLLEQPDELHLDLESSRGRPTIRPLGTETLRVHTAGSGKQRALGLEDGIDEWTGEDMLYADRIMPSSESRKRKGLLGGTSIPVEADDEINMMEFGWHQRPTSSPPTGPRMQSREDTAQKSTMEFLLNSSATPSNSNLVVRSRSVEHPRRGG